MTQPDERTITISLMRYNELREAEKRLEALEAAGVDNWEGYAYAFADEDDDE